MILKLITDLENISKIIKKFNQKPLQEIIIRSNNH
jgi:hypothetical protein